MFITNHYVLNVVEKGYIILLHLTLTCLFTSTAVYISKCFIERKIPILLIQSSPRNCILQRPFMGELPLNVICVYSNNPLSAFYRLTDRTMEVSVVSLIWALHPLSLSVPMPTPTRVPLPKLGLFESGRFCWMGRSYFGKFCGVCH